MMKIDSRKLAKSLGTVFLGAALVFGTAACGDDDDELEDPIEQEIEDDLQREEQIEDEIEEEVEEGT